MSEDTPDVETARRLYENLKGFYPADVIQRRLGLGNSRLKLDVILADPKRRVRLRSWWDSVCRENHL